MQHVCSCQRRLLARIAEWMTSSSRTPSSTLTCATRSASLPIVSSMAVPSLPSDLDLIFFFLFFLFVVNSVAFTGGPSSQPLKNFFFSFLLSLFFFFFHPLLSVVPSPLRLVSFIPPSSPFFLFLLSLWTGGQNDEIQFIHSLRVQFPRCFVQTLALRFSRTGASARRTGSGPFRGPTDWDHAIVFPPPKGPALSDSLSFSEGNHWDHDRETEREQDLYGGKMDARYQTDGPFKEWSRGSTI